MKVLNETTGDQETTSIRDPLSYGTVWAEFIDDIETGTLQPPHLTKSINGVRRLF